MSEQQERYAVVPLAAGQRNAYALDVSLQPVDWQELRERVDPQGPEIKARDLVGRTFTVLEFRPLNSSYNEGDTFFWLKGVFPDTGSLFHTALGGRAVVEVLQGFDRLRAAYLEARAMNDEERVNGLLALGAMRPFTVTLDFVHQGAYAGYYTFR